MFGPPSPTPKLTYRPGHLTHLVGQVVAGGGVTWVPTTTPVSADDAATLDRLACALLASTATSSSSNGQSVGGQFFLRIATDRGAASRSGSVADIQNEPLAQTRVATADRFFGTDVLDFRPGHKNYGS